MTTIIMRTSEGDITIDLFDDKTPNTVANFLGLATGEKEWADPYTGQPSHGKFYNGLTFHRIIKQFMIQGGCPLGTGTGGPGYEFDDEIDPSLKFDKPYLLAMANAGLRRGMDGKVHGTNGSQFFITHVATPWLDDHHTVFGRVVRGQEVVDAIAQGDKMERVEILREGDKARRFDAPTVFARAEELARERARELMKKMAAQLDKLAEGFEKTPSGLRIRVDRPGSGEKIKAGQIATVHYTGMFPDGRVFDSSVRRGQPFDLPVGAGRVIAGWDEALQLMSKGEKATIVLPPHLAYGSAGAGGVIPPNAILKFEIEVLDVK